jgi:hypothetical protein
MARYCGNCGTEVDDTAVFCPTCGQPIDEDAPGEMPAAPAWPDPAATDLGRPIDEEGERESPERHEPVAPWREEASPDAPTRIEERPAPDSPAAEPESAAEPRPPAVEPERRAASHRPTEKRSGPQIDLPITTPVTLSGWLIGIGAILAVVGLVIILVTTVLNVIDLLLLLALLGVAATVFFSARLPAVPHVRLITLVVVLIAFGVALDRIGFRGGGVGELLLFLGSAAAGMGAILLELGQDQPLGGSQR